MTRTSALCVGLLATLLLSCQMAQEQRQEPTRMSLRPSQSPAPSWGAGTQHATGAFAIDNTEFDTGNVDVDTIQFAGEYGYLLNENWEVNGEIAYVDQDAGGGAESTLYTVTAGGRFYFMTPNREAPTALYVGARGGLGKVDNGLTDETDLVIGADAGVIWWPWGAGEGMAVDLSVDYLTSDELERLGLFAGIGFWW